MLLLPVYYDENSVKKINGIKKLRGSLSKYANPELIEKEKVAWSVAASEKHNLAVY